MLTSKTIRLRLVEEMDASFIVSLRIDSKYNKYLSSTSDDVESQRLWINDYKKKEKDKSQFYFIIERLDGTPCGTVRVYDFRDDSFCWGSWILNEDKTRYSAVESALLVYEFGFEHLKFGKSHFEVVKGNNKVVDFHLKFGAVQVGEDDEHYYFEIDKNAVDKMKERLRRVVK